MKQEGHHKVFFTFAFNDQVYHFARNTADADAVLICSKEKQYTGKQYTKEEFSNWLKRQYNIDLVGASFRTLISSFFRVYGKKNTDELNPLQGIPG